MITKLDFVGVPSQDWERARQFYGETLGLRPDEHAPTDFWVGDDLPGDLGAGAVRHGVRAAEERPSRASRR